MVDSVDSVDKRRDLQDRGIMTNKLQSNVELIPIWTSGVLLAVSCVVSRSCVSPATLCTRLDAFRLCCQHADHNTLAGALDSTPTALLT